MKRIIEIGINRKNNSMNESEDIIVDREYKDVPDPLLMAQTADLNSTFQKSFYEDSFADH